MIIEAWPDPRVRTYEYPEGIRLVAPYTISEVTQAFADRDRGGVYKVPYEEPCGLFRTFDLCLDKFPDEPGDVVQWHAYGTHYWIEILLSWESSIGFQARIGYGDNGEPIRNGLRMDLPEYRLKSNGPKSMWQRLNEESA